jgi:hypothetical protein
MRNHGWGLLDFLTGCTQTQAYDWPLGSRGEDESDEALLNNFICICGLLLGGMLTSQAPSPKLSNSEADTSSGHRAGAEAHDKAERANRNVRPRILRGRASWYGRQFEGKKTASGTTFHADGHTAAAEGIPLGSTVKVTNVEN